MQLLFLLFFAIFILFYFVCLFCLFISFVYLVCLLPFIFCAKWQFNPVRPIRGACSISSDIRHRVTFLHFLVDMGSASGSADSRTCPISSTIRLCVTFLHFYLGIRGHSTGMSKIPVNLPQESTQKIICTGTSFKQVIFPRKFNKIKWVKINYYGEQQKI